MDKIDKEELKSICIALCELQKTYVNEGLHEEAAIQQLRVLKNNIMTRLSSVQDSDAKYYMHAFILICEKFKKTVYEEQICMTEIDDIVRKFTNKIQEEVNDILLNEKNAPYKKSSEYYSNKHQHSKTKRSNFPKNILRILKSWLKNHIETPYPTEMEKIALSEATGLDQTQINNWFINARRRLLPDLKNKK